MSVGPEVQIPDLLVASRPRFSLLDAPGVVVTPPAGDGWRLGVGTLPDQQNVPLTLGSANAGGWPFWWQGEETGGQTAITATAGAGGIKKIEVHRTAQVSNGFTVWRGRSVSSIDGRSAEYQASVETALRRELAAGLPAFVERELWTGQVTSRSRFTGHWFQEQTAFTIAEELSAVPLGFVTALAELEQGLADFGNLQGARMIHAQPRVVTAWASRDLIRRSDDGRYLETMLGTVVVPGTGYTGGAPGQETANGNRVTSWAYGSGPIKVLVSNVDMLDVNASYVRTLNDLEARAEQDVVILWDTTPLVTLPVNLCDEYCGSGS